MACTSITVAAPENVTIAIGVSAGQGTIYSSFDNGITKAIRASITVQKGASVWFQAVPAQGQTFQKWMSADGLEATQNPISLTANVNGSVSAYFAQNASIVINSFSFAVDNAVPSSCALPTSAIGKMIQIMCNITVTGAAVVWDLMALRFMGPGEQYNQIPIVLGIVSQPGTYDIRIDTNLVYQANSSYRGIGGNPINVRLA